MIRFDRERQWRPKRPLQAALKIALVLCLLFAVATPFEDVSYRWLFMFAGFAYSAVLSFLTVGVSLLPDGERSRICVCAIWAYPAWVLITASELGYRWYFPGLPGIPSHVIYYGIGLLMAGFVAVAARGWYLYLSRRVG
jgi:hypothetical protein